MTAERISAPGRDRGGEGALAFSARDLLFGASVALAWFLLIQPIASATIVSLRGGVWPLVAVIAAIAQLPGALLATLALGFPLGLLLANCLGRSSRAWLHITAFGLLGVFVGVVTGVPALWLGYEMLIGGPAAAPADGWPDLSLDWGQVIMVFMPLLVEFAVISGVSGVIGWSVMFLADRRR